MQAMVDGALYISALLYLVTPLCLVYAVVAKIVAPDFIKVATGTHLVLLAVASACCGYLLYRLSLPAHHQFGQQIKAMFDCFLTEVDVRPVIDEIARKTGEYRVLGDVPVPVELEN